MSSKDLKKSAYLFDKIGFLNGRLKLGKTTVTGDLKVRSHAVFETGLVDKNLTTVSTDSKYEIKSKVNSTIVFEGNQSGDIILPQATEENIGMIIKIIFVEDVSSEKIKLGFENSGQSVFNGSIDLGSLESGSGSQDATFRVNKNSKVIFLSSTDSKSAGGACGSNYTFTYYNVNKVFVEVFGKITSGVPRPDGNASSTIGI